MSYDSSEDPECLHCRHPESFHPRGPCGAVVSHRSRGTACCTCARFIAPPKEALLSEGSDGSST